MANRFGAITIPIFATLDKAGFKQAQTAVGKFGNAAVRSMDMAAAAAAAFAVKFGVDAVKAAAEAEVAEKKFAKTLKNTTKATNRQVEAMEEYVTQTQMASGVNDNDLRVSLGNLLRVTKNQTKAQELNNLAMDIAAGTGKDLDSVSLALAKAYAGNLGSLTRLGVSLDESTVKNKDFAAAQEELNELFGGQAAAAADTYDGKLKRLNERWGEMQEEVGVLLLEQLEPLMKWLSSPQGGKVIEDFGKAFSSAIQASAEALPGILNVLKKIGKAASGLGIDPSTFMDAKMLAAAAAFRLTPGPIQLKALAAIAAYAATDMANSPKLDTKIEDFEAFAANERNKAAAIATGKFKNVSVGGYTNTGVYTGLPQYNTFKPVANTPQTVINISGAVDPEMTARQLQKILKQSGARAGSYR